MSIELETALSLLKVAKIVVDLKKKTQQLNEIKHIKKSLDQLILREMGAAFEAIGDAITAQNNETKEVRLRFAEDNLLKNTSLDPSLKTGDVTNKYLMARANHGLAYICALRNDFITASKHLLRIFIISPRDARENILPELYKQEFFPKCTNIIEWYDAELRALEEDSWRGIRKAGRFSLSLTIKAAGVLTALAAQSGSIVKVRIPPHPIIKAAEDLSKEVWERSSDYHLPSRAELEEEFGNKIDNRCIEYAQSLLQNVGG
ncbi:hypothetical protein DesfrDRAFT_0808 [Solidesulfovibrio fructosivorans JJ]]|uniref:Putative E3 ubiquitin-protein ligase LIN N-terminal domain-containing protein n=1 Tax=Solidesulfovibrio fructosivorans JJ] TaxID=596151 RepID=E1JT59_SOLFR|nr:hypothetical protein [Solidesulfovibrio fructosivorans]EFL52319.1 hypothetical protein DesfrDRAFT_0808 [Solidesulfovibrio fructosivorans JJ]]